MMTPLPDDEDVLETISSMFPAHSKDIIAKAYTRHNHDVEQTILHLLGQSEESDATLARTLLDELAAEWQRISGACIPNDILADPAALEAYLRDAMANNDHKRQAAARVLTQMATTASRVALGAKSLIGRAARARRSQSASPIFHVHHHPPDPMAPSSTGDMTEPLLMPSNSASAASSYI